MGLGTRHLPLPWWAWPTALSLDAPLVAVIWQAFFADRLGLDLQTYHVVILAMSVWLVYTADRLLDGLFARDALMTRHLLYVRYRRQFSALWLIVFASALTLAFRFLSPAELERGFLLCGLTVVYLLVIHASPFGNVPALKEAQVALLFASGVALFILPAINLLVLGALCLFALLCFLNCSFITLWETEASEPGQGALPKLTLGLTLGLFLAALLGTSTFMLCTGLAMLGLYALHHWRGALGVERLRVLADAALLTPLIYLIL